MANDLLEQDIQAIIQAGGSDRDVENYLKESGVSYSYGEENKPAKTGIPRYAQVEEEIKSRRNPFEVLKEEGEKPATAGNILQPFVFGMKALQAVRGAVVHPLASAGLAAQRGELFTKQGAKEILQGLTGERPAEFGDITFGAGVPRSISSAIGLLTELGLYTPKSTLQTGKRMVTEPVKVAKEAGEEIARLGESAKRIFIQAKDNLKSWVKSKQYNRDWLLNQSQKTFQVADDTINGISQEYNELYKSIGETEVNKAQFKEALSDLWKGATKEEIDDIVNALKTEGAGGIGTTELPATLNSVKRVKDVIQKDIPESVWLKGKKGFNLTPLQQKKVNAYFKLKSITEKALTGTEEGEYLSYLDKKATDVYRLSKTVKRMVIDQTGQPTETGRLVQAFSGKAGQAGKENLFYRLKELNEDAQDIITNMGKFRGRQILKRNIKRYTPFVIGGEVARRSLFRD